MNPLMEIPIDMNDYGSSDHYSSDKVFTARLSKISVLYGPIRCKKNLLSTNAFKYLKQNKNKLMVSDRDIHVTALKSKNLVERKDKKRVLKKQESIVTPMVKALHMIPCPMKGCTAIFDMKALFSHYMDNHHHEHLDIPFMVKNSTDFKSMNIVLNVSKIQMEDNDLIGIIAYEQKNLNPFDCVRNSFLSKSLHKYSKHTFIMLFGCRSNRYFITKCNTTPVGITKERKEILIIWAVSPTPKIPFTMRATIRDPENKRYYRKYITLRSLEDNQNGSEFIDNDTNCIVCAIDELMPLSDNLNSLKINIRFKEKDLSEIQLK